MGGETRAQLWWICRLVIKNRHDNELANSMKESTVFTGITLVEKKNHAEISDSLFVGCSIYGEYSNVFS